MNMFNACAYTFRVYESPGYETEKGREDRMEKEEDILTATRPIYTTKFTKRLNWLIQILSFSLFSIFQKTWIEHGTPRIYWLPAFFSAQSFFVAVLQNYSRQHGIAYNLLTFDYLVNLFIPFILIFIFIVCWLVCAKQCTRCFYVHSLNLHLFYFSECSRMSRSVNVYRKLDAW